MADLTAPIHTGPSVKPPPLSRWAKAWDRLRKVLRLKRAVPVHVQAETEGFEGTLVEFLGWEGMGEHRRVLYNPFPKTAEQCVDWEKPLVLLLDSERVGDRPKNWVTSPIQMVYCNADGLPVRVETKSSAYALMWLDKPAPESLPEDDGRVRG